MLMRIYISEECEPNINISNCQREEQAAEAKQKRKE